MVPSEEPIKLILALAEEVPYNVQMLAHNCWEELRSQRRTKPAKLTANLVQAILLRTVNGLDPLFTQTWNRLTAVQQKTLIAVIRNGGVGMSSTETAKSIRLSVSSVQSALRGLHDQSILRDDPAGGSVRMRFDDPFFAEWIRITVSGS